MKKLLCAFIALALVALMLPVPALAQGEDAEANGVYDPFASENQEQGAAPGERHTYEAQSGIRPFAAGDPDYRYVNVLLSQAQHDSSTVWFTGNYALCDASGAPLFQVESDYAYILLRNGATLELRSADGTLLYTGSSFSFREYLPPAGLEYNYFKVEKVSNGTSPSDRLYKGALYCSYQSSSPWQGLCLVNRIYIEEYLKGVLPAEIGSGNPAAALQAQAIVARNFTVKSKRTDGRIFDVYDYNASQVYFGIYVFADTDAAVEATRTQVLLYNSAVIKAYYCNSNGGYTETSTNEWGGVGQSGTESVQYDEYDLRAVRGTKYLEEVIIPAMPAGNETEVRALVANALIPALTGYSDLSVDNVSVGGISMTQGACYAACSCHDGADATQICTHFCSLDVTFTDVCVKGATLIGPVQVNLKDIDFYVSPANERPLGFFTNGSLSHYWLSLNYSATDPSAVVSYTIRHARHGSGVGLSQQGAIARAKDKHSLTEILSFYFPGCTVANFSGLYAADALADISTVSFPQTWDVLGGDAYVYAKPNLNALFLGILNADACVQVLSASDTWIKINYNGREGYVLKAALARTLTKAAVANISESLDIRSAPNSGAGKVGTARPGDVFVLLTWNAGGAYHKIRFGAAQEGYISARYAKLLTATAAGDEAHLTSYAVNITVPAGYTDTTLWVDGVPYPGTLSSGVLSARVYTQSATSVVMYAYNTAGTPTGMSVWLLSFANSAYNAVKADGFTDLLSYVGFSARIRGNSGIRYISGISAATRGSLTTTGIHGYTLAEYGTVAFNYPAFYDSYPFVICQNNELPTGYGRSYWIENGVIKDYIAETVGGIMHFASVRINIDDANLSTDFYFRSYIKLINGNNTIILYGAPRTRSIYTIAKFYMTRGDYTNESAEGQFLNRIIDIVENNR